LLIFGLYFREARLRGALILMAPAYRPSGFSPVLSAATILLGPLAIPQRQGNQRHGVNLSPFPLSPDCFEIQCRRFRLDILRVPQVRQTPALFEVGRLLCLTRALPEVFFPRAAPKARAKFKRIALRFSTAPFLFPNFPNPLFRASGPKLSPSKPRFFRVFSIHCFSTNHFLNLNSCPLRPSHFNVVFFVKPAFHLPAERAF